MNYSMARFINENLSPDIEKLRTKHNLFLSICGTEQGPFTPP